MHFVSDLRVCAVRAVRAFLLFFPEKGWLHNRKRRGIITAKQLLYVD